MTALRKELDAVTFVPMGATTPVTWADSLVANYTDGIVILHRGRIVYERYFGALSPGRSTSLSRSPSRFLGTLATMLMPRENSIQPRRCRTTCRNFRQRPGDAQRAKSWSSGQAIDFRRDTHLWVAETDGQIVGSVRLCLCLKDNGRHRAEVQKLFVLTANRGQERHSWRTLENFARAGGRSPWSPAGSDAETV